MFVFYSCTDPTIDSSELNSEYPQASSYNNCSEV